MKNNKYLPWLSRRKHLPVMTIMLAIILVAGWLALAIVQTQVKAGSNKTDSLQKKLSVPPQVDQNSPISEDSLWQKLDKGLFAQHLDDQVIRPKHYQLLSLDKPTIKQILRKAPLEGTAATQQLPLIMTLPLPDGRFGRFRVEEAPIMEAGLAAEFPEIKTYRGQGVDDPTQVVRFDLSPLGFHAMILSPKGTIYIDPRTQSNTNEYMSYYRQEAIANIPRSQCLVKGSLQYEESHTRQGKGDSTGFPTFNASSGPTLRTYRLAIAVTGEFSQFYGGTVPGAMSGIITIVNRVDGVYEQELGIRMVIVNNDSALIFTNPATDGYTNNDGFALLSENQTKVDSIIGPANYDIGHVFNTSGDSVAGLGVVCVDGSKANGVTGLSSPIGDDFAIDFVAHEMGHQFGANHTFNGTTSTCGGGNRNASTAYEPGSGSTIMAYAGICEAEDLQPHSDPFFHAISFDEINAYITTGSGCAVQSATGNQTPTVNAGADYTIPKSTPFTLTAASANDPDNDPLTYNWEEFDLGTAGPPNTDSGNRPIFRSFAPTTSPSRTFPQLSDILNNRTTFGESLPTKTRTMNFRLTVRDNRSGGGGVANDAVRVMVNSTAGPFIVTSPGTTSWPVNSTQTIAWNVSNTTGAGVNCANVKISLSTDGGNTFPIVLAASTPNDGSEPITVPNNVTSSARVKVEAVDNIFFAISTSNFTIFTAPQLPIITSFTPSMGVVGTSVTITGSNFSGATSVKFNNTTATQFTVDSTTQITATVPVGATTGAISVTTAGGTNQSINSFIVAIPPTINSFTPLHGVEGTSVTINGSNLSSVTNVSFNGVTASFNINSNTSITTTVPVGATTGKISVTNAATTVQSGSTFKVLPAITSFNPNSGARGSTVVISGTTLGGVTAVKFNNVSTTFTINSTTQLTATVPNTATTGKISITNPDTTITSASNFTVVLPPTISTFSPLSGGVGTIVTINGTNLTGITDVSFNGVTATNITPVTANTIKATVAPNTTTGKITVTNAGGTATSVNSFKITPKIESFSPASGLVGSSVTITGSNFTGATTVKFGTAIASFTVNSATQITAIVPTNAITSLISVTTPDGTSTIATSFVVIKAPTITSFSPLSFPVGARVTISGTALDGVSSVSFNGIPASFTISGATIVAIAPIGATNGNIMVSNVAGMATSTANFSIVRGIGNFTPTTGPINTSVTITGTGFTGTTSIKFGVRSRTVATDFTIVSDNQLIVAVPTGSVTGPITITTPSGSLFSTASFTVTAAKKPSN